MIGQRIKQRRLQLGISQQELADVLRSSQQQINRYENDKNSPSGDVIVKIARVLDTSADWLLGLTDEIKPVRDATLSDIEQELIKILRSKSADQQQKIVDIAKVV